MTKKNILFFVIIVTVSAVTSYTLKAQDLSFESPEYLILISPLTTILFFLHFKNKNSVTRNIVYATVCIQNFLFAILSYEQIKKTSATSPMALFLLVSIGASFILLDASKKVTTHDNKK